MKIQLKEIPVRELVAGYADTSDNDDGGVVGFGGKLDIRPPYQREFIYSPEQERAVIKTIINKFPLNVMYWAVRDDGNFEIIDGQQRTLAVCRYIGKKFAYEGRYFDNLKSDEQEKILDYQLMIYQCSGSPSERLDWFRTINIAGEELTPQELKNAVFEGSWVTDAKRYFSKKTSQADNIGGRYLTGVAKRQDFLETAIKWISKNNIEQYMATNQHKPDASELWLYFLNVINWIEVVFPNYKKEMKGVPWGFLYNDYKDKQLNPKQVEAEVDKLMMDDEVTNKKGIYSYIFTREEKHLNIREFTPNQKREAYERQAGLCKVCGEHFGIDDMEADHIKPWCNGGKTEPDNCQMLCKTCHSQKSSRR